MYSYFRCIYSYSTVGVLLDVFVGDRCGRSSSFRCAPVPLKVSFSSIEPDGRLCINFLVNECEHPMGSVAYRQATGRPLSARKQPSREAYGQNDDNPRAARGMAMDNPREALGQPIGIPRASRDCPRAARGHPIVHGKAMSSPRAARK